jgi:site-specific recombinase XerD
MTQETHLKKYEDYLLINNCTELTIYSYRIAIKQLLNYLKKEPKDITEEDIAKYNRWAREIYNKNSLTAKFSAVNHYIKFIKLKNSEGDYIKLKPPKRTIPNKKPFSRDEIQELFDISHHNKRDNALLKTLYFGMIRLQELINLNIDDIDYDNQKLVINSGKGDYNATVNLDKDALVSIETYLETRRKPVTEAVLEGLSRKRNESVAHFEERYRKEAEKVKDSQNALFLNRYGYRVGRTDVTSRVKEYCIEIGLERRVYPHLFRVSAISHMAEAGVRIEDIRRQSRHHGYDILQGYMQLSDEHVKSEYTRGLSFNKPEPKPKEPKPDKTPKPIIKPQITKPKQMPHTAYLEMKLIEKLALGEISSDAYSHAILKLKQNEKDSDINGYS